ncbi:hypothetical protein BaRGS_00006126 [Batillaria attramentaria]|uniref:Uncharacterized protein n=1 Tax=Batillaria attramentaria TaxID=370345 RepID=A0ABD0LTI7_9CAEN
MEDASARENAFLRQVVAAQVIAVAVGEAYYRVFRQREKDMPTDQKLQTTLEMQSRVLWVIYNADGNEQYSRRESLRIFGGTRECGYNFEDFENPDDLFDTASDSDDGAEMTDDACEDVEAKVFEKNLSVLRGQYQS